MDLKGEREQEFFENVVSLDICARFADNKFLRIDIVQWKEDRVIPRSELLKLAKGADGILCLLTDKIDAEVLDAAGTVKTCVSSAYRDRLYGIMMN